MTVKELIRLLSTFDQDLMVEYQDWEKDGMFDVEEVKLAIDQDYPVAREVVLLR